MARARRDNDKVKELKLDAVYTLVQSLETHIEQARGRVWTARVLQEEDDPDPASLVEELEQALIPMTQAGHATSMIKDDLATIRMNLGQSFGDQIRALLDSWKTRARKISSLAAPSQRGEQLLRVCELAADALSPHR